MEQKKMPAKPRPKRGVCALCGNRRQLPYEEWFSKIVGRFGGRWENVKKGVCKDCHNIE